MIYINNKVFQIEESENLISILNKLNLNLNKGIAVAVNNNIIPKTEWEKYIVIDNDKITLIKATQGG